MTEERQSIISAMGKRLCAFRKARGFTQKEIAKILGVTERTYAGYERGEHDIGIEKAILLAPLYRTTLKNLIDYKKGTQI